MLLVNIAMQSMCACKLTVFATSAGFDTYEHMVCHKYCASKTLAIDMQGVAACHKEAVVKREDSVKWLLDLLADDKDLSDILGEQADSLRAYLDDKEGLTHATFKDSQVLLRTTHMTVMTYF